jgi:hypothetical protein
MNKLFEQFSLAAGGSHYPKINPNLQEQFGHHIVNHIVTRLHKEVDWLDSENRPDLASRLFNILEEIQRDFDMEPRDPDWDPAVELQRIIDEFDIDSASVEKF